MIQMINDSVLIIILKIIMGLSSGFLVSGGMYALITTLGIINRLAQDTHTASRIKLYEECVIWGATIGNVIWIYSVPIPSKMFFYIFFGLISGIYAGCLAVALAEVIKTIPVFIFRTGIREGLGFIILSMAIGKCVGGIVYFFMGRG